MCWAVSRAFAAYDTHVEKWHVAILPPTTPFLIVHNHWTCARSPVTGGTLDNSKRVDGQRCIHDKRRDFTWPALFGSRAEYAGVIVVSASHVKRNYVMVFLGIVDCEAN